MKSAIIQHIDSMAFSPPTPAWPESMRKGARFKQFINPFSPVNGLPKDVSFSYFEIEPGVIYPSHVHDNPEIYYVLKGEAKMTWGDQNFMGRSGTMIYTPPGQSHRIEVIGQASFVALVFWWAPNGEVSALGRNYKILE